MIFLLVYIAVVVTLTLMIVGAVSFGQLEKIDVMVEKLVSMKIEERINWAHSKLDPDQLN